MTPRAVAIGFLCACLLCGVCFFNDQVIRQTTFIRNFMPISVFGALFVFVLFLHPALARLSRRLTLSAREIAVAFGLALSVSWIAGYGLVQYLTTFLMLPHFFERTEVGWKATGVKDMIPRFMLADPGGEDETRVLDGFAKGLGEGDRHISVFDVPWWAWRETLGYWSPVLLAFAVATVALAFIFHRQWSEHEHLPYPIAKVAHAMLPGGDGFWGPLVRNRLFWWGFLGVAVVHLNNYASQWLPGKLVSIPLSFDFSALRELFPYVWNGGGGVLFTPNVYLTVVGLAFFLQRDVSLSLGLAPYLYCAVAGALAGYGIAMGGPYLAPTYRSLLHAGAFSGVFVMFLYTGRHHYWAVVRRALCPWAGREARPAEGWAARVFVVAFVCLVWLLSLSGLDWQLAFLYAALALMIVSVLSRVVSETGVIYILPQFTPCAVIIGLMGERALGAQTVLLLLVLTSVLMVHASESLMTYVSQGARLVDLTGAPLGRFSLALPPTLIAGFAIAMAATVYLQYDRGATVVGHPWIIHSVPRFGLNEATKVKQRLEAQGVIEETAQLRGWGRFANLSPRKGRVTAFCVAFALTVGCAYGRMRFARWPFHPAMFVVLATWQSLMLGFSLLLGWLIKTAVVKYGGHGLFVRLQPLMIGVIGGEVVVGVLLMIAGAIYYFATGQPPKPFKVFQM